MLSESEKIFRDNWNRMAELSQKKNRTPLETKEYEMRILFQNQIPTKKNYLKDTLLAQKILEFNKIVERGFEK